MMRLIFFSIVLLGLYACENPYRGLTDFEIKAAAKERFLLLADTSEIAVVKVEASPGTFYKVAYNTQQDTGRIYFFDDYKREYSHMISFRKRGECTIEHVDFVDMNRDDLPEMLITLYFKRGIDFRRREFLVYSNPFKRETTKKVFDKVIFQSWGDILGFDSLDNPLRDFRYNNDAIVRSEGGDLLIEGLIDGVEGKCETWKYDLLKDTFILTEVYHHKKLRDESFVFNGDEKGKKQLVPITGSRPPHCNHIQVYDAKERPVFIPKNIVSSLRCTRFARLSPNSKYLIFEDSAKLGLSLYRFSDGKTQQLLSYSSSMEGISDLYWKGDSFFFIAVNHEEFVQHTRLYICKPTSNGFNISYNDVKITYSCDDGLCHSVLGEDFSYDKGVLKYVSYGNNLEDYTDIQVMKIDF